MRFLFDKASCQNPRRALRREWLLTNGLGDYASSTILCCNTRKYHGLLTVNTPQGRHVLLSTVEESLVGEEREFFFSTRQHPMTLYPHGNEYQDQFTFEQWPIFTYRLGNTYIIREMLLVQGKSRLVLRWTITGGNLQQPLNLRIKPLLAFRNFHALTHANSNLHVQTGTLANGFEITPYDGLPTLYVQTKGQYRFTPSPDWFYNVEYQQEHDRGFPYREDLFSPGLMDLALPQSGSLYMVVGTELCDEDPEQIWLKESTELNQAHKKGGGMIGNLIQVGKQFLVTDKENKHASVLAGYHWFDAWGRDTLIALPGLTFQAGKVNREKFGLRILAEMGGAIRNGLVPNMFAPDGNHAYNTVDASLWYAFAVQSYLAVNPNGMDWVRQYAWPALKSIVQGYRKGPGFGIYVDAEGLLHAGDAHTQLTWMDANANGRPVTPRHGCPVEINALWYNTLAFVDKLSGVFNEPEASERVALRQLRKSFFARFFVHKRGGYLGDVWRDGVLDTSIRPNQIFAVSLPYPILEDMYQTQVVERVRNSLLTPYGLRTLSPDDPQYCGRYEGDPFSRDSAYHQGTVWPWLLGHYTDALLRVAWDVEGAVKNLLDTVTPLLCEHLSHACLGSISEVFDASPPYRSNGCISQAWSVAECLRMLQALKKAAPNVYRLWEERAATRLANLSGDTAGVCRITMTLADVAKPR